MVNISKTLKRLLNAVNGYIIESYLVMDGETISGGGYKGGTTGAKTKAGYRPIGVVGVNSTVARLVPYRWALTDDVLGSTKIRWAVYNAGSSSASSGRLYVHVLWAKVN